MKMERLQFDLSRGVRDRRGFTLIEILVVVGIIGILAAIAIPQLSRYRTRGYNTTAVSDLKNAAIAQESYYTENRRYSTNLAALMTPPYNFYLSDGVDLAIVSSGTTGYVMTANHSSGDVVYTLSGPGGSIIP